MEQRIALMRQGVRERVQLPDIIMQRIPAQIEKQYSLTDPKASPFYKPFLHFPATFPEATRTRLAAAAATAISENIIPSFQRLHAFFVQDYLPACYDQVGIWQLPQGDAMYRHFVREF